MSNKKLLLSFLLLPLFLSAQQFNVKWGEIRAYKGVGGNLYSDLVGSTPNHYYYVEMGTLKKPELFTYDYSHKLVRKSEVEITVDGNKAQIKTIKNTRSNSYAFSEFDDNANNRGYIYAHKISADGKIDPNGIVVLDKSKKMALSSNNRVLQSMVGGQASSIRLFESPDSTMLANIATSSAGSPASLLYITVFDESLNKKWERELAISSKYADKELSIRAPYLANDGRVFFIGYASDKNYRHKKIAANSHPVLFVADDKSLKEIDLDYSVKAAIQRIRVISVSGNEVILGGTYNTSYDCGGGVVLLKADVESGKVTFNKEQPIKMEDLDFSKGSLKKHGCVEGAFLVDCNTLTDGTIVISAAQGSGGENPSQTYDKLFFAFDKSLSYKYSFGVAGWASYGAEHTVVPLGNSYAVIYIDNDARGNVLAIYVNGKGERSAPQKLPSPKMYLNLVSKVDDKRILIGTSGGNVGIVSGNYQLGVLSVR